MKFEIKNRVITGEETLIVGDNSDYIAEFTFDEEWNGVTKTARFVSCGGDYVDQIIKDDKCDIPCETLKCGYSKVGVYSAKKTTTEHKFFVTKSIKDETGCVCKPTPSVYEQLTKLLDELYELMPEEVERYFTDHKDEFKGDKGEKGDAGVIEFLIVNELPTENINESAMYLRPSSDPASQNSYDEYIYTNGAWECIGTANVKVDLTDYVKNTDYAFGKAGVVSVVPSNGRGIDILSGGILSTKPAAKTQIDEKKNNFMPLTSATNDYAVKVGLTTNEETLTDEEKKKALNWLGAPTFEATQLADGSYSLTITTPTGV